MEKYFKYLVLVLVCMARTESLMTSADASITGDGNVAQARNLPGDDLEATDVMEFLANQGVRRRKQKAKEEAQRAQEELWQEALKKNAAANGAPCKDDLEPRKTKSLPH